MASRRPIETFQLTGYMLLSQMKKYICCFMGVTYAINNIYKLISFLNYNTRYKSLCVGLHARRQKSAYDIYIEYSFYNTCVL